MKVRKSEFERLRKRRLRMLTGARGDARTPEVIAALDGIERTARKYQKSLHRPPKHAVLWRDLARLTPCSNAISCQYQRLSLMAQAWATPGQQLYGSASLLRDVKWGLEWLDAHEFNAHTKENGNWYDFEIDAPGRLTDTLTLLGDELTLVERHRYLRPVLKFDASPDVITVVPNHPQISTGANRTDKAMVDLIAGILLEDEEVIGRAVASIRSVFRTVTEGDGFYADASFVFHRFFPYTGNYGVVLLEDVADAAYLLSGTRWALKDRERAMAARWAMESFTPLVYRGGMMDMVRGRLISFRSSPSHAVGRRTIAAMLRLSQTASAKDSASLLSRIKGWWAKGACRNYVDGLTLDLIGEAMRLRKSRFPAPLVPRAVSKVFASMDRVVHLRPDFGVGISMHSTRIQNYESINGDDLHGWHTSDGMLYLYDADLMQYDGNFWPTVDPERLPGTTAIAGSHPPEGQFGGSSAVGGTSLDCYGTVMMQLNVFQGRLQAKKSWFLFDDEVVALGADIQCTVPGKHVETIVENRKLTSTRARPLVRPSGARWANLPASASAPPIGYVFPGRATIKSRRARRVGSWRDIDTGYPRDKLSATYQTLWIDHGAKPKRASYAYVLLPGRDAAETKAYVAKPAVRVVENNAKAQAIVHPALGITAVNIWKAGATAAGITADAACSVMIRRFTDRILISFSEPTQVSTRPIRITIDMAVGKSLATDSRIKVLKRKPSLTLSIHAEGAAGKPLRAEFRSRSRP